MDTTTGQDDFAQYGPLADRVRAFLEDLAKPDPVETPLDPSVRIVFEIVELGRAFEYHLGKAADASNMTALQARYAWVLATRTWGVPQAQLEVQLGLGQPAVSRMVQRMRARGLVTTDVNSWDSRGVVVSLTDEGRAAWECARDRIVEVAHELVGALRPAGEEHFRDDISRVTALDERQSRFRDLRNPQNGLP